MNSSLNVCLREREWHNISVQSHRRYLWDQNRRELPHFQLPRARGEVTPAARPTYLKCSSYVYSACPEQPDACAVLVRSHFQNSCKILLFSWNVQEKTESNNGRKYMIFRFMAKNSYTELWVPNSISLEPRTKIGKYAHQKNKNKSKMNKSRVSFFLPSPEDMLTDF